MKHLIKFNESVSKNPVWDYLYDFQGHEFSIEIDVNLIEMSLEGKYNIDEIFGDYRNLISHLDGEFGILEKSILMDDEGVKIIIRLKEIDEYKINIVVGGGEYEIMITGFILYTHWTSKLRNDTDIHEFNVDAFCKDKKLGNFELKWETSERFKAKFGHEYKYHPFEKENIKMILKTAFNDTTFQIDKLNSQKLIDIILNGDISKRDKDVVIIKKRVTADKLANI